MNLKIKNGYPKIRVTFLMKKIFLRIFLISFLFVILIYVTNITAIPKSIVLFQGEKLDLKTVLGVSLKENKNSYKAVETSASFINDSKVEKKTVTVSLFNLLDIKNIEVNTIPKAYVVPLGNSIGLKLYTSGVLVVGLTEIEGKKPCENTGIEQGDMIVQINEEEVTCTQELVSCLNRSNGENIIVKYIRNGEEYIATVSPIRTNNDEYKLGLWVRDRCCRYWNN